MCISAGREGRVWTQAEGARESLHAGRHKAVPGSWRWWRNARWCRWIPWGFPGCWRSGRSFSRRRSQRPNHRRSRLNIFRWHLWQSPYLVTLKTSYWTFIFYDHVVKAISTYLWCFDGITDFHVALLSCFCRRFFLMWNVNCLYFGHCSELYSSYINRWCFPGWPLLLERSWIFFCIFKALENPWKRIWCLKVLEFRISLECAWIPKFAVIYVMWKI